VTEPYYQDELTTLYLGSCLEQREWLAADVLVTDPPYGTQFGIPGSMNVRGGYGRRQNHAGTGSKHAPSVSGMGAAIAGDADTNVRDTALMLWGARPALVFGSPRMPDPPLQLGIVDRLVWDKRRPGMNGGPWRYRHESIYVTEGWERVSDAAVSILSAFPEQTDHIHGKPLALMVSLVEGAPAGVIADPFAGSLTTLVAARLLGRPAVGVELEERYCELAATRFATQAVSAPWTPQHEQIGFDL